MQPTRRNFLKAFGVGLLASQAPVMAQNLGADDPIVKPPRLKPGDTVGLINPASNLVAADIEEAKQTLATLGLRVKLGQHLLDRYGYLAGKDSDRAADVNQMFADPGVQGIITMRGGWGCNRILSLLNYSQIRATPKIIMGYSDITSLLLAIYARSGVVTFHGPVATSTWNPFSVDYVQRILFNGEAATLRNPTRSTDTLTRTQAHVSTITSGKVQGKLIGGNLSVLTSMVGSPYLPNWNQAILFVEDIGEDIYRVDRMLTQLKLAGILDQLAGFIFAQCTDCAPDEEPSLTLTQVLSDHIKPLGIPAWYGSMIGHILNKFTLPIGVGVEIDASQGSIQLLESAVL